MRDLYRLFEDALHAHNEKFTYFVVWPVWLSFLFFENCTVRNNTRCPRTYSASYFVRTAHKLSFPWNDCELAAPLSVVRPELKCWTVGRRMTAVAYSETTLTGNQSLASGKFRWIHPPHGNSGFSPSPMASRGIPSKYEDRMPDWVKLDPRARRILIVSAISAASSGSHAASDDQHKAPGCTIRYGGTVPVIQDTSSVRRSTDVVTTVPYRTVHTVSTMHTRGNPRTESGPEIDGGSAK